MVMGVGATRRLNAVRSGVAWRIVWTWILAVPVSTALAALATLLVIAGPPLAIVLAIFVLGTAALALLVQRTRSKQLTGDFASRR
jgi:Flp pilus assembly protein TadB